MAEEIFYTDNPSEYPLLEGLYVTERPPPGAIEGANLNTVGHYGTAVRGPSTPQVIASSDDFTSIYGERDFGDGGPLISEMWAARVNKQYGTTVCRRVVAADSAVASLNHEVGVDGTGAEVLTVAAANAGVWAALGRLEAQVLDASDGVATHFNVKIRYLGEITTYENLNINTSADDNLAEVVGDEVTNLVLLTKVADGRPNNTGTVTEAAWVTARSTDDYMPVGDTAGAAYTGVDGSDGTLVSGDYIAGLDDLAFFEDVAAVMICGASVDQNALNGQIAVQAAAVSDRAFLTWSGVHGQSRATEITNAATDFPTVSDRVDWCFNSYHVRDPKTNLLMQRGAHEHMGALYSQTEVDTHVGSRAALRYGAGINKVTNTTLSRGDLKLLKAAGICTLEKVKQGFLFRSGVTMSLVTGKTEIAQRRMRDFLQTSAAEELVDFVKAKGTGTNRILLGAMLINFSQDLKDEERVVEEFEVRQQGINTKANRDKGIEKVLWRVKTLGHWLSLVIETEIGVGVTITEE